MGRNMLSVTWVTQIMLPMDRIMLPWDRIMLPWDRIMLPWDRIMLPWDRIMIELSYHSHGKKLHYSHLRVYSWDRLMCT